MLRPVGKQDRCQASASLFFPAFDRQIRTTFNKLEKADMIRKLEGRLGYVLNPDGGQGILKPLPADRSESSTDSRGTPPHRE